VGGAAVLCRRQGDASEHRGSSREAPDMVTGNGAHRNRVVDGEVAEALQRRGSSGGLRRGPSGPIAGGGEGGM
jgi:hypothetical protein